MHCTAFHFTRCSKPFAALLVSLLACFAMQGAEGESTTDVAPAASVAEPEQIDQWVAQLDDDQFITRQQAQQQLEQAGEAALDAVAQVARGGSLESATRAINILLKWSEASQKDFRIAVLSELVNLPDRPREAAMAARLLSFAREQSAIVAIKELGGEVRQLRDYSHLQIVIDKRWTGGNDGLKHLAEVPRATVVSLWVAPITEPAYEHLAKLTQVQLLQIYGTSFSDPMLQKLRQQLQDTTTIEYKNGPMLGIIGKTGDVIKDSVAVDNVVIGGAAHKAGILPGDRITALNGEKLGEFHELTERIATYEVGDTAKFTILRKKQLQTVEVTFDQWGAVDNTKLVLKKQHNLQQLPIQIRRLPNQGLPIQVPRR